MRIRYIQHGHWPRVTLIVYNIIAFCSLPFGLLYVVFRKDRLSDVLSDWAEFSFCKYKRDKVSVHRTRGTRVR